MATDRQTTERLDALEMAIDELRIGAENQREATDIVLDKLDELGTEGDK